MINKQEGRLRLYIGPMFASKTTHLQREILALSDDAYIVVKPMLDSRYATDRVINHDEARSAKPKEQLGVKARNVDERDPQLLGLLTATLTHVLIDETNFFSPLVLVPQVQQLLALGINVVGAGLLLDAKQDTFGATLALSQLPQAEVVHLTARCDFCNRNNATLSYSKVQFEGQVKVGGDGLYGACCPGCWNALQAKALDSTHTFAS